MQTLQHIALAFIIGIGSVATAQEAWQPKKAPLMTRWAKDVTPAKAHPEYPRPQLVRDQWQNLNGLWQYAITPKAAQKPTTYEGQILVPFPIESALSGVMKQVTPDQRLWYRRAFSVPANWSGKRVLLHFGAVDWDTAVQVNGKEMGTHRGGYDAFSFDITNALKAGENEIVVGVMDPTNTGYQPRGKQVLKPGGIFYVPTTGIWQTVWLEPVPQNYIRGLKIVPDVDRKSVYVTADVAGDARNYVVEIETTAPKANADDPAASVNVVANLGDKVEITLTDDQPVRLWTPETPYLYDLVVRLHEKKPGQNVTVGNNPGQDKVRSYFGMRKIALGKDDKGVTRIMLNNKFVFQMGFLDQGFWPDGLYTAPTDAALKYDIEVSKQLGMNMARKHVKVEPARWYYHCDKLGMLVWQDLPSGNFSKGTTKEKDGQAVSPEAGKQYETELKAMIDGFGNHPSIVMWVVFNEGWGQYDTVRLTKWAKELDPSRLVNCASGWHDRPVGDVIDMHSYPGPNAPKWEETRAAVLGEFGGLGLAVEGNTWTQQSWGYRGMTSKEALNKNYLKLMHGVWRLRDEAGLSAAVYTQTTDVETECNGLLTYDREVIKVDVEKISSANRGIVPPLPQIVPLVATSKEKPQPWRFTTDKPADDWMKADFNDSAWKQGNGGFGTKNTPGAVVGTEWRTGEIWIRRTVEIPEGPLGDVVLIMHHDEDADVYINGVLATQVQAFTSEYEDFEISKEARAALKPGKNVIAVRCRQTQGGQFIDVGLGRVK